MIHQGHIADGVGISNGATEAVARYKTSYKARLVYRKRNAEGPRETSKVCEYPFRRV